MKASFLMFWTVVFLDPSNSAPEDAVRYRSENPERTVDTGFFRDVNGSLSFSFERAVQRNSSSNTGGQTTTSVPEDDFWWYLTTSRRPFLSAKDYPGRPGVAVWKEILPGVTSDTRKKKLMQPTAAGVSSSAIQRTRKGPMIFFMVILFGLRRHFF